MEIKNDNHILNIDPTTDFGKKGGEDFVQQKNPEMIPKKIINNFVNKNACFVNASAGTGKTTTITEVYIKLLESGEKVSNIIVITFTKASANEMLLKIRNRIRKKINEENINKNYWQNIYKELLSNSKISTINAFAHSIVKEYSMHLGMPPNIYILEEDKLK